MDDALVVRGGQAVGDLRRRSRTALRSGSAPAGEPLAQRLALEQLHDRVGGRRPSLAEVVDREDVRVRQRGDRLRLALEAGERRRVAGERARAAP